MLDQRGHREKWFRLSPQKYDQDGTVLRASHERRDEGFIELGRGAARRRGRHAHRSGSRGIPLMTDHPTPLISAARPIALPRSSWALCWPGYPVIADERCGLERRRSDFFADRSMRFWALRTGAYEPMPRVSGCSASVGRLGCTCVPAPTSGDHHSKRPRVPGAASPRRLTRRHVDDAESAAALLTARSGSPS